MLYEKVAFDGRVVVLGYGSVGQCVLPAIPRHFEMPASRITVIEAADHSKTIKPFVEMGVSYQRIRLTPQNVDRWLTPQGRSDEELQAILSERQPAYYEHRVAA